jgi:hypothetical protein
LPYYLHFITATLLVCPSRKARPVSKGIMKTIGRYQLAILPS